MIELRKLEKIYKSGVIEVSALKGISMVIEKGEFVAIMGPSGSGKSTLMNILGCLDHPSSGEYLFNGQPIQDKTENELSQIRNQQIGFVFQSFNLLPRITAVKNVELPLFYGRKNSKYRITRALELLKKVGLNERVHHLPNELSGGQKQRVAIARALANNPPLILADEPTGNLDSQSGEEIMNIFQALNKEGVTVIIVTHEPNIAQQCKRVVTFKDGNIISDKPVTYTEQVDG